MANQLQRDLGHKLVSVCPIEDAIEAPIAPSTREDPIPSSSLPQMATIRRSRDGLPFFSIGREEYESSRDNADDANVRQPNKSSSDYNLSKSLLVESLDRISIIDDHFRKQSTDADYEELCAPSKKRVKREYCFL